MHTSSDSPCGPVGVPVGSPSDPTAEVVMLGPPSPAASPCGAGELGRELSSASAVACKSELDVWVVIGRDLMSLTLFIRAFAVVEYSGKAKVHSSSSLRAQPRDGSLLLYT